jgi:CheY-like chemotaxis protein
MSQSNAFRERKGKVLVVDPSSSGRQMMVDVVRTEFGFAEVEGKPSVEEVLRHLEIDSAVWVLTPLMADQAINAMHIIKLCTEIPELRHVRVSLLLEESESYAAAVAFEHGLLSAHRKPNSKDGLMDELKALRGHFENADFNDSLVASEYLRKFLGAAQAELDLAKALLETFPGNARVLLGMAEPLFKLNRKDEAKKVLSSVKMIEPKLAERADAVGKTLFGEGSKIAVAGDIDAGDLNYLGATNCVVVDSDETVAMSVAELVKKLGVQDVQTFHDGEAAAKWFESNPEPQLVIMEWRIPGLSAPMLLQRIRGLNFLNVPIIILSSLLKPGDMPLVREMGVAAIIAKPLNKDLFIPNLISTMQQERAPTDAQALERKIRQLLAGNKREEALPLKAKFLSNPHASLGKKKLIEAEWAFACGNFAQARDVGAEALKQTGDSYLVLNLLGKTFMRLTNFKAALKCFQKAQEFSPNNLDRLCNIAETQADLGDAAAAEETMSRAKAMDSENRIVAEGEVKVALAKPDPGKAKALMQNMESLSNIVAYMNNKAVAHAKCGLTKEAIEMYDSTVESIPDDRVDLRAVVRYNKALSFARSGELDEAAAEAESVAQTASRVQKKAKSLAARIRLALKNGTELKLKGGDGSQTESAGGDPAGGAGGEAQESQREIFAQLELRRGDLCCFMIYSTAGGGDVRATALFAKPPRFMRREAIEREEAMGDAKVMRETA